MLFNIIIVYIVQLFEVTCVCVQGTSTWWRWATELFRYPAESLDYGIHAVMADTRKKRVTMQGLGTPVSAAGQGRWDVNMLADFCWMLKRETLAQNKKRKKKSYS